MSDLKYGILVLSCDRYSALWGAFIERFFKCWPEKTPKIYILTNNKKVNSEKVITLNIGDDVDWSSNLINALKKIDEDYVFVTFEDVFLKNAIDENLFGKIVEFLNFRKPSYLNTKANPMPPKDKGAYISRLPQGMHYRASLANAFWRKSTLIDLLVSGESAWDFEHFGTVRSNKYDDFFGTTKQLLDFDHVIIRGKIVWNCRELKEVIGTEIESAFLKMSYSEFLLESAKQVRNKLFIKFVPLRFQQIIRGKFARF